MKFLFGIMHPRRLPHFLRSMQTLDYVDILLAKNMEILTAQRAVRKYFLEHDYDYLLFTSDDVAIPYLAPLKIIRDVECLRFDMITGWSRIDRNHIFSNISGEAPDGIEAKRDKIVYSGEYDFYKVEKLIDLFLQGIEIIPVWFLGWSITAMSRKVVEKWTPKGWYFAEATDFQPLTLDDGRKGFYASSDLWFSYQMWKEGFKKYADLTVYVPHFKSKKEVLLVGKEPPELEFIGAKKSLKDELNVSESVFTRAIVPEEISSLSPSKYPSKQRIGAVKKRNYR